MADLLMLALVAALAGLGWRRLCSLEAALASAERRRDEALAVLRLDMEARDASGLERLARVADAVEQQKAAHDEIRTPVALLLAAQRARADRAPGAVRERLASKLPALRGALEQMRSADPEQRVAAARAVIRARAKT